MASDDGRPVIVGSTPHLHDLKRIKTKNNISKAALKIWHYICQRHNICSGFRQRVVSIDNVSGKWTMGSIEWQVLRNNLLPDDKHTYETRRFNFLRQKKFGDGSSTVLHLIFTFRKEKRSFPYTELLLIWLFFCIRTLFPFAIDTGKWGPRLLNDIFFYTYQFLPVSCKQYTFNGKTTSQLETPLNFRLEHLNSMTDLSDFQLLYEK